jgi:phosphate transport system substrate-binding protein
MRLSCKAMSLALALVCATALQAKAEQVIGSGSTFVYPVMSAWVDAYSRHSEGRVSYQPIGSSQGIAEVRGSTVDFGISDAPLQPDQLSHTGLMQFPLVIGGIVPVINLDGIAPGQIRLTGKLLADIYLGKIGRWNSPAIAALNPAIALPDRAITVVFRTDGSGTTFNFADYLSKVSDEWKTKVGAGTLVRWPVGVGTKGSGGVADAVARTNGAIGYLEYSYVVKKSLSYALVQNRSGNFVTPKPASFRAAAENADWDASKDFYVLMTDAAGADAYPITATSFVLMSARMKDTPHSRDMLAFFRWALDEGRMQANSLNYVPLPASLVQQVEAYWQVHNLGLPGNPTRLQAQKLD